MGIKSTLRDLMIDLDRKWDHGRLKLRRSLGGAETLKIEPYRGLGRPDKLILKGRVFVDRGSTEHETDDDLWDNLVNMYRRINTTEIPGARLRVTAAGAMTEVITDDEGYFDADLRAAGQPFSFPRQTVDLALLEPVSDSRVTARGEVVVRSPASTFLVISDIDDTLVHTQATNLLAMARATFLGNARSRTPFPGVAELYRGLVDGRSGADQNPMVFISRSPWNLYDLFDQFCDLQGIPSGRVFNLRDWGFSTEGLAAARARGHKFGVIRSILDFEPDLPVILIGDSGQKDPEIYHAISEEYPGRLMGAFIRNVTRSRGRDEAIHALAAQVATDGEAFLQLADTSLDIATSAAEHEWIRPEALEAVSASMEADTRPPDPADELIDAPPGKRHGA